MTRLSMPALAAFLVLTALGCAAQDGTTSQSESLPEPEPPQESLPEVVRIGEVTAYPRQRRIEVDAQFGIKDGILEFFGVAEGGKAYESVLQLNCTPSKLHAALLAVGFETGDVPQETKGDYLDESFGTGVDNPKSYLDVFVEWTEEDNTVRVRAEQLLFDIAEDKPAAASHWVFTGSFFVTDDEGKQWYGADVTKSVIAVWYDPSAVINLPVLTGNPYRGPSGFRVNSQIFPETNDVKVIILPHQ